MRAYTLGLYEKAMPSGLSWKEKLTEAKQAGFDFVEISIDETDAKLARLDMTAEERAKLVRTMEEVGVPIRSMCLSGHRKYPLGHPDPAVRRRSMEIMEKAILLADDLGIRVIQLAGYDVYYEEGTDETRRLFSENLRRAALLAARHGVLLGFETMETAFMNTVGKAMNFVREVNSAYLGVYPDLGNITNAANLYGTDVYEDIRSGCGHLHAMHLKETVDGVFREVPFGTGHVDFERGIRTAWECGVRRFVTEFWYIGAENWREDLVQASGMMRAILDRQAGEEPPVA